MVGIQEDRDGDLWIATSTGTAQTFHRLTSQGGCAARYPLGQMNGQRFAFLIDTRDRFWTHPSEPVRFGPYTDAIPPRPDPPFCLNAIKAMEAADGSVWFACDDGTYRVDPATGSISSHAIVDPPARGWRTSREPSTRTGRASSGWAPRADSTGSIPIQVLQPHPAEAHGPE